MDVEYTNGLTTNDDHATLAALTNPNSWVTVSDAHMVAYAQGTVRETISLDVRGLSGSYYIVVGSRSGGTSGSVNTTKTYKVWGE